MNKENHCKRGTKVQTKSSPNRKTQVVSKFISETFQFLDEEDEGPTLPNNITELPKKPQLSVTLSGKEGTSAEMGHQKSLKFIAHQTIDYRQKKSMEVESLQDGSVEQRDLPVRTSNRRSLDSIYPRNQDEEGQENSVTGSLVRQSSEPAPGIRESAIINQAFGFLNNSLDGFEASDRVSTVQEEYSESDSDSQGPTGEHSVGTFNHSTLDHERVASVINKLRSPKGRGSPPDNHLASSPRHESEPGSGALSDDDSGDETRKPCKYMLQGNTGLLFSYQ